MILFALSRWPGLMPPNFSAIYALMFCAGVYFPRKIVWLLPFVTALVSDILLNRFYYHVPLLETDMAGTYLCYVLLVVLGRLFKQLAAYMSRVKDGHISAPMTTC